MQRRNFLRATSVAGIAGLAGCTGMFETTTAMSPPPLVENRPDAVYYPTHIEGMEMAGMGGSGRLKVGLMYSYPHRFWTIAAQNTNKVTINSSDDVHLMASLWDKETMTVLPAANVSVEILKGGNAVGSRDLWPMLSQNMGFHFGDNLSLDGDGTYTAKVDIGAIQARGMGALQGAFGDGASIEVEFEYSESKKSEIMFKQLEEKQGKSGAVKPMEMKMMPISQVPKKTDLPGKTLGEGTSGDAKFVALTPEQTPEFVEDGKSYLAVSPRTPQNLYPLPLMGLSATLTRDGNTVYEGDLNAGVHPELGHHYGAAVESVESGDSLTISVNAPPQVARHEGYETAFIEMSKMELTVR